MRKDAEEARTRAMRRKVALSLILTASAAVTVPLTLARGSRLQGIEVFALHLFFLLDVAVRPAADGVDRESRWRGRWGKGLMLALVYLPVYFDGTPRKVPWMVPLGTAVTILGAALALTARLHLGRRAMPIVATVENATLCKDGLYQSMRHPIYTGFSLAFLGHQMSFMFIPGLIAWGLFLVTFIRARIAVEEQMLIEQFGKSYTDYQQSSWKLFPCIY
jgi:protein-S-isoprenylcysteine O-methyltransferase Ste14